MENRNQQHPAVDWGLVAQHLILAGIAILSALLSRRRS